MKRSVLLFSTLLALAGCAGSPPQCATIDAQGIVTALRPEEQFRSMLVNAVERTQTAAIVKNRDGASAAEALTEAVDRAVDRHHAEWERNLVSRWGTLSGGEIEQVCIAIAKRDEPTFMRFAQRIGGSVKSLNEPLLDRAATEVLAEIFERPRS